MNNHKRGPGRPCLKSPLMTVTVRISEEQKETALMLGDGNFSLGVRNALDYTGNKRVVKER